MNQPKLPRKSFDNQLSLFPKAGTPETIKFLGLAFGHVEVLVRENLISFDPLSMDTLGEEQHSELMFVGRLAASPLTISGLHEVLKDLEKPYHYSHSDIYYDWTARAWKVYPKADIATAVISDRLETARRDFQLSAGIAASLAAFIVEDMATRTIHDLKGMKAHNRKRFDSAWGEIMKEVVEGTGVFWQVYIDNIRQCVKKYLDRMSTLELHCLIVGASGEAFHGLASTERGFPVLSAMRNPAESTLSRGDALFNALSLVTDKILEYAAVMEQAGLRDGSAMAEMWKAPDHIDAARSFLAALLHRGGLKDAGHRIVTAALECVRNLPATAPDGDYYIAVYTERGENEPRRLQFYSVLVNPVCFEISSGGYSKDMQTVTDYRFLVEATGKCEEMGCELSEWLRQAVAYSGNPEWKVSASDSSRPGQG